MMDQNSMETLMAKLLDKKLNPIISSLDDIKHNMNQIEESIAFLSNKYDDLNAKVKEIKSKNDAISQDNSILRAEIQRSSNIINQLRDDLDKQNQYTRRECLEFSSVPYREHESTNNIVKQIGGLVGVEIQGSDISISHRLTAPRSQSSTASTDNNNIRDPVIIAKFARRDIRNQLYIARKGLREKSTRDIGFYRSHNQKIYISESLTQRNKKLFNRCLQVFKRELNYKFLWTSNGKILLRKDGSHPVIKINNEADLEDL